MGNTYLVISVKVPGLGPLQAFIDISEDNISK